MHKIDTTVAPIDVNDGPQSVIHAPADFQRFDNALKRESTKSVHDTDVMSPTLDAGAAGGLRERVSRRNPTQIVKAGSTDD